MFVNRILPLALLAPLAACGDDTQMLQKILDRLDKLEQENQQLTEEVRSLRAQLAGAAATAQPLPAATQELAEQTQVVAQRTSDLDQVKVEASHRFPVSVTGMALFNGFIVGPYNGGSQLPFWASANLWPSTSGATFRQTIFGLSFHGPEALGAKIYGSVDADFAGGAPADAGEFMRLRTANITMDWKNQSVSFRLDAPLISPRSPSSLAEVAFPPLSGAGNLWLWQPQVRVEQRFSLADTVGIKLQGAVYETDEAPYAPPTGIKGVEEARPGYEGRVEFWSHPFSGARYEIGSGFHLSTSHVGGASVPSRIFTTDWLISPWTKFIWTGQYFDGQNLAGVGGAGPGFTLRPDKDSSAVNYLTPVRSIGGWTQLSFLATSRLTFNLFAGDQANRAADLNRGNIASSLAYAGNAMYHLTPNVLTGVEAIQYRTYYQGLGIRLLNRYDVALAYLF